MYKLDLSRVLFPCLPIEINQIIVNHLNPLDELIMTKVCHAFKDKTGLEHDISYLWYKFMQNEAIYPLALISSNEFDFFVAELLHFIN